MKVGFYLDNSKIPGADLSCPEQGNPGVGGTQFNFVSLPYYLTKNEHLNKLNLLLYASHINALPPSLNCVEGENCTHSAELAAQEACDIFVFRPTTKDECRSTLNALASSNTKAIAWLHSDLPREVLDLLSSSSTVERVVCVGFEQLERLRSHPIFAKSTCILNGFDAKPYLPSKDFTKDEKLVVFLGSLVPSKGFHCLAKVWPNILFEVPTARLIVIGSGNLYSETSPLGKWGIANEEYEKQWRHYLSDDNGEIHRSVKFAGKLGREKIEILQRASVGVINPSGETENCPGSAIEFQASGTPIVSGAFRGLLDTVKNGSTGLLGRTEKELEKNIIDLLKNSSKVRTLSENSIKFVYDEFSYDLVCSQWNSLFEDVLLSRKNKVRTLIQSGSITPYKLRCELLRLVRAAQ